MAEGYSPEQISPFLVSLRRTGYEGTIALLMSRRTEGHRQLARQHHADLILLSAHVPTSVLFQRCARSATHHLAARGIRAVPLFMWLPRLLDATIGRRARRGIARGIAVANVYPIALARYAYYLAYLDKHAVTCDRVLLSDVRDVLFQRHPFSALGQVDKLQVFVEDRRMTLGQCTYNAEWLASGYGTDVVKELRDCHIVCSGVTLGDRKAVIAYLRAMIAELSRLRSFGPGTDQSCHNVLIHRGRIPTVRHANEDGPVYTMGHVPPQDLSWDAQSRLVGSAGTPYTILHQYDRHLAHSLDVDSDAATVRPRRAEI